MYGEISSAYVEYMTAGMAGYSGKRGYSSAGRAPALHAGGQRFDPA